MTASATEAALDADWLEICRRAEAAARRALESYPLASRSRSTGRGEGGDISLVIDRAAEEAIEFADQRFDLPRQLVGGQRLQTAHIAALYFGGYVAQRQ